MNKGTRWARVVGQREGRAVERARLVAFVRAIVPALDHPEAVEALEQLSDAIEDGEHWKAGATLPQEGGPDAWYASRSR